MSKQETRLRISDSLSLPLDFVTSTCAIVAQKGKGKSYTAKALAEELLDAGQQVVVVDPTDAWFGLRSSKDGRSAGYPIAVFGGDHGDVALEPDGGRLLAEAVVRERFSAIISTENLSKGKELAFLGDFLETFYRLNRQAVHLFIDEADIVAPQKPFGGEMRTCGAADDIVRRGRKKGIGCTLITQRSSVLNKNVLSQADMLVALGCSHPLDLDAIGEWVKRHADPKLAREMMESLPSLPRGEAWVWNPAADIFKRVRVRDLRTFDSGATPKPGEKAVQPKVLAPVDIQKLGASIAAQVERAKQSDPTELRKEVARLKLVEKRLTEQALAAEQREGAARAKPRIVDRPVLKLAQIKRVETLVSKGENLAAKIDALRATTSSLGIEAAVRDLAVALNVATKPAVEVREGPMTDQLREAWTKPIRGRIAPGAKVIALPAQRWQPKRAVPVSSDRDIKPENVKLEPRQLKVLQAAAWWAAIGVDAPDAGNVAFIARYSPTSSSWEKIRGLLRSSGLIEYPTPGAISLTDEGRRAAPPPDSPPTLGELHGAVLEQLKPVQRKMMLPLLESHADGYSVEDLGEMIGSSPTSSSFEKVRGKLRTLGLIEYPRPGWVRATALMFPKEFE